MFGITETDGPSRPGVVLVSTSIAGPTSTSFPEGLPQMRSEAEVRALILAKIKAQDAYNTVWNKDTRGMSDDERIDHQIAVDAAWKALSAASNALLEAKHGVAA